MDPGLEGFAIKKERKFACPNALEFSMATVMSHNDDQNSVKILKAQPKIVAANEIVHYNSTISIQSRKKKKTHILHNHEALSG